MDKLFFSLVTKYKKTKKQNKKHFDFDWSHPDYILFIHFLICVEVDCVLFFASPSFLLCSITLAVKDFFVEYFSRRY